MKSDVRASCWSVTINNPVQADEENINMARQKGWKVEGQKEVGDNGTPHYQLLVESGQVRFISVKKAFPRAHIEICRDKKALKMYVHKEETKVEELATTSDQYPSQQKMWDMFSEYLYEKYEDYRDSPSPMHLWSEEKWLLEFDHFVNEYIIEGYVLESIAVNPQVRSALKKFGYSIYQRSCRRKFGGYIRRQTDRQTDETSVCVKNITNAVVSSCSTSEEGTWETQGFEEQEDCGTSDGDGTERSCETDF